MAREWMPALVVAAFGTVEILFLNTYGFRIASELGISLMTLHALVTVRSALGEYLHWKIGLTSELGA